MRPNLGRLSTFESLWEAWRDPIRVLQLQGRGASRPLPSPVRKADSDRCGPSAATVGDLIAEVSLAQVATRHGADDAVGLIRITGRWDPSSAVALHEFDGDQERTALIAIRKWMILDEVPA